MEHIHNNYLNNDSVDIDASEKSYNNNCYMDNLSTLMVSFQLISNEIKVKTGQLNITTDDIDKMNEEYPRIKREIELLEIELIKLNNTLNSLIDRFSNSNELLNKIQLQKNQLQLKLDYIVNRRNDQRILYLKRVKEFYEYLESACGADKVKFMIQSNKLKITKQEFNTFNHFVNEQVDPSLFLKYLQDIKDELKELENIKSNKVKELAFSKERIKRLEKDIFDQDDEFKELAVLQKKINDIKNKKSIGNNNNNNSTSIKRTNSIPPMNSKPFSSIKPIKQFYQPSFKPPINSRPINNYNDNNKNSNSNNNQGNQPITINNVDKKIQRNFLSR